MGLPYVCHGDGACEYSVLGSLKCYNLTVRAKAVKCELDGALVESGSFSALLQEQNTSEVVVSGLKAGI